MLISTTRCGWPSRYETRRPRVDPPDLAQALKDDYSLSDLWQIAAVWQPISPAVIWWNKLERVMLAVDDLGCRGLPA